jgi:hypothetical protein
MLRFVVVIVRKTVHLWVWYCYLVLSRDAGGVWGACGCVELGSAGPGVMLGCWDESRGYIYPGPG